MMRKGNDDLFPQHGRSRPGSRQRNDRRAAIARRARQTTDTDIPAMPETTLASLQDAWRRRCETMMDEHPQQRAHARHFETRARTARLGKILRTIRGTLTSLRRGDVVLVWDDNPAARTPTYSVWHPRNQQTTGVQREVVELLDP
jgi:hypothetical protein